MSGIAQLYNIPGTPEEANSWAFAHASHHRDIIQAIFRKYSVSLPEYVLEPLPLKNLSTWIYQHQQMHNDMNAIAGVSGYNLSNVEWENIESRSGWIFSNATEHTNIAGALGLGPETPSTNRIITAFRSVAALNAGGPTYNFPAMAFGPASGDRYILIAIGQRSNPLKSIAGVTVGGVSATVLAQTGANIWGSALAIAFVPTGVSGAVAVTLSGGGDGVAISVYSVRGLSAPAASFTAISTATSPSATFSVNKNGAIIGVAVSRSAFGPIPPAATWTNLSKDSEIPYAPAALATMSSASQNFASFQDNLTVLCSFTNNANPSGCFAAFNP